MNLICHIVNRQAGTKKVDCTNRSKGKGLYEVLSSADQNFQLDIADPLSIL
jgi:hypothetical protein